ncbi:MAG: Gfo/Idh/MocA family protein [Puniceicoccaceae bacterium]
MKTSRRQFVKSTVVAGASLPLFNIVHGGNSGVVRHASFGASGMALTDIKAFLRDEKFDLVAVAEVDDALLKKLLALKPDVRVYKDWRVMLKKEHKNLDSVNVSTPDHMHAAMAVSAMNLGLHAYVQKPLAQTVFEARRMAQIAKQKGVITQMGTQGTSSTYERLVVRMVQDGVIGKIKQVHLFSNKTWGDPEPKPDRKDPVPATLDWDMWLGIASKRPYIDDYYHPDNWRKRLDFGTGTLGDMGCHIYSPMFASLDPKAPVSVKSVGGKPNGYNWAVDESFEYIFPGNQYTAGNTVKVTWCDGSLRPPAKYVDMFGDKMPDQGGIYVGTEGIILAPHKQLPVPYPREKYADFRYPKFPARDHYLDFLKAVRGEKVKPLADFHAYGGPLTETVLLGALSSHFPGETLEWDAAKLQFKKNKEANKLIRRKYRKGWEVEGLA